MKENVDLTENMLFSRNANMTFHDGFNFIRSVVSHTFPWNLSIAWIESDDDLSYKKLVPTGNRKKRAEFRELENANSTDTCDCCGDTLIKHPWDRTYGLCKRCYKDMEEQNSSLVMWRYKEERDMTNRILNL